MPVQPQDNEAVLEARKAKQQAERQLAFELNRAREWLQHFKQSSSPPRGSLAAALREGD